MKVLFICNLNLNRSKTAEEIFADTYETKSAGLFNDTPVTAEQLSWADVVIVMEEAQHEELNKRFPELKKKILSLTITDDYNYMSLQLVELLKAKMDMLGEDLES